MTQLQKTKKLAAAFRKLDRAHDAYLAAQKEFDAAYQPWAAGQHTSRDAAREYLTSTGYIPTRNLVG